MSITDAVDALNILEKHSEDKQNEDARQKAVSFGRTMSEFIQSDVWNNYLKPLIEARLSEATAELMAVQKGDSEWPNNLIRAQEKALACKYMIGLVEAPILNMKRILREDSDG